VGDAAYRRVSATRCGRTGRGYRGRSPHGFAPGVDLADNAWEAVQYVP
jgi:hypothetical protein